VSYANFTILRSSRAFRPLSYGGVRLWLGDAMNATIAETTIERTGRKWAEEDAARWLHETALQQFPDSKYAKSHTD
jgi:hypothetical protein